MIARLILILVAIMLIVYSFMKEDDNYHVETVEAWDADSYESY